MSIQNETSDWQEREMMELLSEYRVHTPPSDAVDDLICRLQPLMPAKAHYGRTWHGLRLLHNTVLSFRFMNPSFWVVTLLLYLSGYAIVMQVPQNPIQVLLFLTPLPLILSMRELFRGREEGVYELELSCSITPQELMVARALTTLAYNMALNTALSFALVSWRPTALLLKIMILWISPLLLTGAITLFLCGHIRGPLVVPSCLCCWVASAWFLSTQGSIVENLLRQDFWILAIPAFIGAALYIQAVTRLHSRYAIEGSLHAWN